MDSKGKRMAVLVVLCALIVTMAAVAASNFNSLMGNGGKAQGGTDNLANRVIEEDGRVHGADLSAFLKDSDFFDAPVQNGSAQGTYGEADGNMSGSPVRDLTVLASSVERDIRVKVVDDKGDVVQGQKFMVEVADTGVYADDDKDGVVLISGIKPGEYKVSIDSLDGFKVPESPVSVRVKSIVSYTVIDDISYFVHDESEIDVPKEDANGDAVADEDEDDTQHKTLIDVEDDKKDAVKLGIDVSKWNGDIDWEIVKAEGVDFAIIRCGYRGYSSGWLVEDPNFYQNLTGAKKAGVKVGLYFFTQAINIVEAVEEASMVVALLGENSIEYPVFIDTEGSGGENGRADNIDPGTRTAVMNAFCRTIENAGLSAGVYSGRWWFNNNLKLDELEAKNIWLAEYRHTPLYEGRYDMWQYTSSGSVAGIEGRVDLNVSYLGIK